MPAHTDTIVVAESFLVDDGRVRGHDRHRHRFARGCAAAGVDPAAPWAELERALPATGRWFPRLELRADGEARSAERRYTLDRTGWHVARSTREGAWSIRYRASRPPQLCTAWRTPKVVETCEPVELLDDSADGRMLLRFAGRHWAR